MFNKKVFSLVIGYIAGSIVSSVFSNKKGDDVKKELKKVKMDGGDSSKVFLNNFLETHRNLLDSLKKELLSEENKELFNSKKSELLKIADDYKLEGEEILKKLKKNGKDYLSVAKNRLYELYEEKKQILDNLKSDSPEKVENLKKKLLLIFEDFKKKIK